MSVFPYRACANAVTGRLAALLALLILSVFHSGSASAHGVTLKMQHTRSHDSLVFKKFIAAWTEKVHDEAGGRISFQIAATDEPQTGQSLFQAVQNRVYDVVWMDLGDVASAFPRLGVFGLALPGNTSAGSSKALWDHIDMNNLGFREFKEMRVVAASRHGAPLLHLRDRQISSLADLKDATIAVTSSDAENFLKALGASPQRMPASAMRDALAGARVDGVLLSWDGVSAAGIGDLVKVHVAAPDGSPWAYGELSVLLLNPDAYRSLTDDLKQVVRGNIKEVMGE